MSDIKSKNALPKFFSNPWVGFIGTMASILGVVLAVLFYMEAKDSRELAYYVNPARAVVVQMGQASKLKVNFDNKPIETDITAAQIALWNRGEVPIKSDNILNPIIIRTENNIPILEATIRKTSRDVTRLNLNTDDLQRGQVSISWNILEQNDGGIIQLIYAGNQNVRINLEGVIEGQKDIFQISSISGGDWWLNLFLIVTYIISLTVGIWAWFKEGIRHWLLLIWIVFASLVLIYSCFDLLVAQESGPPFGF